jgi:prolyl-tRNA editing enzyme YbaK/EbsC (Cys-tRNA(Pro) deacylase)
MLRIGGPPKRGQGSQTGCCLAEADQKRGGNTFRLVARGDARLDNGKAKAQFGARPRMLKPERDAGADRP